MNTVNEFRAIWLRLAVHSDIMNAAGFMYLFD